VNEERAFNILATCIILFGGLLTMIFRLLWWLLLTFIAVGVFALVFGNHGF